VRNWPLGHATRASVERRPQRRRPTRPKREAVARRGLIRINPSPRLFTPRHAVRDMGHQWPPQPPPRSPAPAAPRPHAPPPRSAGRASRPSPAPILLAAAAAAAAFVSRRCTVSSGPFRVPSSLMMHAATCVLTTW
jgi:hypothetical protein